VANKPNPFKVRMPSLSMDTLHAALNAGLKMPAIGVTQGGSSRKNSGARVAAVVSKPPKEKQNG
jgi:hypothetical protein